jgi:5-methylcytosine-specific restriction endonuclease McrA
MVERKQSIYLHALQTGDIIMKYDKHTRIVDEKALDKCKQHGYCELCGQAGNDPHHLVSRGASGPDHAYNLICLCRSCHRKVHDGYYNRDTIFKMVSYREKKIINFETIYKIMRGEK